MFNDEIDTVRINAINSLRKLTKLMRKDGIVSIKEEQLDVILSSLQDNNRIVRLATLHLIKDIPLQNITCLLATIHALLTNMSRRYNRFSYSNVDSSYSSFGNSSNIINNISNWNSGDVATEMNSGIEASESSIFSAEIEYTFRSLQHIGKEHGTFVEYLIEELLEIDTRFMSQERHLDDLLYIGVVIVISNASIQNQNIFPIIPRYVLKHLRYFVQKFPSFFPPVSLFGLFSLPSYSPLRTLY